MCTSQRAWCGGLSPRARGNRELHHHRRARHGTIPACAGEPLMPCRGSDVSRDYPRVRGGTALAAARQSLLSGLSPRARGNQPERCLRMEYAGTIPACAGEPC